MSYYCDFCCLAFDRRYGHTCPMCYGSMFTRDVRPEVAYDPTAERITLDPDTVQLVKERQRTKEEFNAYYRDRALSELATDIASWGHFDPASLDNPVSSAMVGTMSTHDQEVIDDGH